MTTPIIYDLIGIGIGPFNLGLAALTENIPALNCLFLDENPTFNWHPGLLLPWARMQVPFHADLVTLADPCSKYSYLAFLKARKRLLRFTILEKYFPLRSEYNDYCSWVAKHLKALKFGYKVENVEYDKERQAYRITAWQGNFTSRTYFYAKKLVIGIGSRPFIPKGSQDKMYLPYLIHASDYLYHKKDFIERGDITIIGSGQSAAEIFYDLLQLYPDRLGQLTWITRSGIFPMDYSKFSCEMTSPEYTSHFFSLSSEMKEKVLAGQDNLYKGINRSLIQMIYERLFDGKGRLDISRHYAIDKKGDAIFIQNAELHTHGFNSADLGLGTYRNMVIVNSILGYEHYGIPADNTFQDF